MKIIRLALSLYCLLLFGVTAAFAQDSGGSLSGIVTDSNGAAIAGAKVTAKQDATGRQFTTVTTGDGFYAFNSVVLPSLSSQKMDMYFKVVQKNKEEKNSSTLYLLVSSGNENFASPDGDTTLWNSSKMFLNSFVEKTTAYSLEQNIKHQENTVKEFQNKLTELQNQEKDLGDKIRQNQEDQKTQQLNIENHNKILEDLKLKRKV